MGAVVDALACYDLNPENIRVLSIGCGKNTKEISVSKANSSLLGWRDMLDYIGQLQSHNAIGQAGLLIGRQNIVRLNPEVASDIKMDHFSEAKNRLPSLGVTAFKRHKEDLRPFFEAKVTTWRGVYSS